MDVSTCIITARNDERGFYGSHSIPRTDSSNPVSVLLSLPLTPPDSPSSDDEDKNDGAECDIDADDEVVRGINPEVNEVKIRAANFVSVGYAGGVKRARGGEILIERPENSRASSQSFPSEPSSGEDEKELDTSIDSVGAKTVDRHVPLEGADKDAASSSAAVSVMQQKGGNGPSASPNSESFTHNPMGCPPLRSVLKRSGQRSKGHRVSINESKNRVVESDYIILLRGEADPQLITLKSLELGISQSVVDQLTLSPPDGYKDAFLHSNQESLDDSGKYINFFFYLKF